MINTKSRASAGGLLAFIVMMGALSFQHAQNLLDNDEGVILSAAWNIYNGQVPYSDFFEFVPPGAFYLVFAFWKVFGPGYWIAKAVGILAIAAGALGVYLSCRLLAERHGIVASRPLLYAAPLVFCLLSVYWSPINHNTFNQAVLVWSTFFALRAIVLRSSRQALVSGLLAGVAAVILLHRTAALVVAFLAVLAWLGLHARQRFAGRAAAAFLGGALLLPVGVLLAWEPQLLYDSLIRFPMERYRAVNSVDPTLFGFMLLVLAAMAWLLRRHLRQGDVLFLLLLQACLLLTTLQRPDITHVSIAIFPGLCLVPLLAAVTRNESRATRALGYGMFGFVLLAALPAVLMLALRKDWVVDVPHALRSLQYVREQCGNSPYLYAGPFSPGIPYETRKLNPTRYSVMLTDFNTAMQFEQARKELEDRRPACVVTGYAMADKFDHSRENVLDRFISSSYRMVMEDGRLQVWRLADTP